MDLKLCKEKGIRVTNTLDILIDDVADLAIGIMLAVSRRLCEYDRYVRAGKWKRGDYKLTTKVGYWVLSFVSYFHLIMLILFFCFFFF